MSEIKELFGQLNTTFDEFKAENDKRLKQIEAKGHADPLLEAKVDKINAAISDFDAKYKARLDEIEAKAQRQGLGGVSDDDKAKADYRAGFNAFARKGEIQAALSVGSDPDGGYSVPIEVDTNVLQLERNAVTMRRLANVVSLGTPNYTKLANKGGASSGWVGETDARHETTGPSIAALTPYWGEVYANTGATQQCWTTAHSTSRRGLPAKSRRNLRRPRTANFLPVTASSARRGSWHIPWR